ncbi:MAG: hypothetical protein Q8Q48_02640 [Candidatus Staskawiczbacteria bacterium]|nr:hypothetical protein [Candidatus Staskawiczbacteria bacterium]
MLSSFKAKISSIIASSLSVLGIGGNGVSAVCQATCVAPSSVLPIIGVSLAATPLAFIGKYQIYIWWIAVVFLIILLWVNKSGQARSKNDKFLVAINFGLIVMGFPYFRGQVGTFFLWAGLSIAIFFLFVMILVNLQSLFYDSIIIKR